MMEPVPETERMEEFRSSPVPTLRLYESVPFEGQDTADTMSKPPTLRRSTDPTPSSPQSPGWSSPSLPFRPRTTSPYSRGHLRSRSSASALAPLMSRTQSLPGVNASGHFYLSSPQRPSSPHGSPGRNRTPRKPVDEVFPGMPTLARGDTFEPSMSIPEDEETPRAHVRSSSPTTSLTPGHTFPRNPRPASPLRNLSLQYSPNFGMAPSTPSSLASSPSYQTSKFSDSFPAAGMVPYASSSVPSTPSSIRSRSPSISSLETIPDSPDAEEAALEAERIARLKAAADAADGDEAAMDAKNLLDSVVSRGRTLGLTFGSRDKRKRWSVCGAERRGDLDLETIWED